LRPWEFVRVTPAELAEMVDVCGDRERRAGKDDWRRAAFIAAAVMNSAGKTYRRAIKPDDLLSFSNDKHSMTAEEKAKRKREAQETLLAHKKKFWTKFKDESVAKLTGE
jgi:hypothetical protein